MDSKDGILEFINKRQLIDYIQLYSKNNVLFNSCISLYLKYNRQTTSELPIESLFYLIMKEQDRKIKVLEEELLHFHNTTTLSDWNRNR